MGIFWAACDRNSANQDIILNFAFTGLPVVQLHKFRKAICYSVRILYYFDKYAEIIIVWFRILMPVI